jgi:disulfide bond formation protein DsbB
VPTGCGARASPHLTPLRPCARAVLQLLPSLSSRNLPRRAVALAAFLLAAGTSLFVAGIALAAQGTPHATPLLVLGAVMFVPVRTRGCAVLGPGGAHTQRTWRDRLHQRARAAHRRRWRCGRAWRCVPCATLPAVLTHFIAGNLCFAAAAAAAQGAYHTRIAYKAWRGEPGYDFNALPEI